MTYCILGHIVCFAPCCHILYILCGICDTVAFRYMFYNFVYVRDRLLFYDKH